MKNTIVRSLPTMPLLFCVCLMAASTLPARAQMKQDRIATADGDLEIHPVNHASFVMRWKETTIAVDPVGDAGAYKSFPKANVILLTDIHQDHLNAKTLEAVAGDSTKIVAPTAVADMLPAGLRAQTMVLTNGQSAVIMEIGVEAIPMYNTTQERSKFHVKGRGNGYVLSIGKKRIYISGDTEDIPEMRALKNIDAAFLCMNLPYTMTVDQAASAVGEFKPKVVYPYHSRGSDLERFKKLVAENGGAEVRILAWYGK